jgi:hypothetical protein
MKITAVPADRLTPEQFQAWGDVQRADPALESPYFRPEFTQAVAAVRPGVVWVGVVEDGGGFFPFERRGCGSGERRAARPAWGCRPRLGGGSGSSFILPEGRP